MTTFATQVGFSGASNERLNPDLTYFQLQRGFSGASNEVLRTTYFALQKGFSGASNAVAISIGRILLDGDLYTETALVTLSSSQGEYTVTAIGGYFPIYPYTNSAGTVAVPMYAVVASGIYVGFLNFTPTAPAVFDVNLEASTGMAVKTVGAKVIPFIAQIPQNEFCYCKFECEYTELAFTDGGTDYWKNDKSSFIFQKYAPADTIDFELWKNGAKIADIDNSDYGQYFDFGDIYVQPTYKGVVLDWSMIWAFHGFGLYHFKAVQNILGTASTFESRKFRLMPYDDEVANSTVKIESYQNGNIIGSEFDFTGLNWYSSYRIAGKFSQKTPILEVDNYVNSDYRKEQIQDRIRTEYTLQTKLLPSIVANALNYNQLLANQILITDYNVMNFEIYRQKQVRPIGIEVTEYEGNRNMSFAVKFEEVTDFRKRNF